jgi:drug/metabolite transporter (DMT)-like permease
MATGRAGVRATPIGVAAMLGSISGFALLNVVVKLSSMPALTFAFYRLWIGTGVMLLAMGVTGRRLTVASMRRSLPAGVLFGLNIVCFFSAIKATSITDVLVIGALQPAATLLVAGPMFGERVGAYEIAWTLVSIAGATVVVVAQSGTPAWSLRGDLLAVGALGAWTAYFLTSKRVRRHVPAVEYMTGVTIGAALIVTPLVFASGQPLTDSHPLDWVWLPVFVAGAQAGHTLIAWAQPQVDVAVSSLFVLVEPPVSAVAALVFLGEPLPALSILGGMVTLLAMAAVVRRATRTGRGAEIALTEPAPP